ncbi:MAG: hypothetical protein WD638_03920 [Nitriliruptoraceae bacterium]
MTTAPRPAPWGRIPGGRLALLLLAGTGLVLGTVTGLARAGIGDGLGTAGVHGVVMTLGFLGTVIALERAIALGTRWGYLGPLLSGLAVLLLPVAPVVGGVSLVLAGVVVVATYAALLHRGHLDIHLVVMGVGGLAWVAAAVAWLGGIGPIRITPLLAAYLVLTIVGERLELSRLTLPSAASRRRFLAMVAVFVLGAAVAPWWRSGGLILGGIGLVAQVGWLARHDLARRTIHRPGIPRFAAICLLSAYAWMAVSGALWVAIGLGATGALLHDAMVHALFLGFVLSMVMGHAPIIVPAILRTSLRFSRLAYAPLVLLHGSVVVRIAADLAGSLPWREVALYGNITALVLFLVVTVRAVRRGRGDLTAGHLPPEPHATASPPGSHTTATGVPA